MLPYPTAVSSKLFLFSTHDFIFCASKSQLHSQTMKGERKGKGVSEKYLVWESLSEGTKLGSTVPKPWQLVVLEGNHNTQMIWCSIAAQRMHFLAIMHTLLTKFMFQIRQKGN